MFDVISIHAPAKGATFLNTSAMLIKRFQSTLPRRERRKSYATKYVALWISIHAPAKGATLLDRHENRCSQFQSTLPRRERPFARSNQWSVVPISIHAPAKGATISTWSFQIPVFTFQSTLPRRERLWHFANLWMHRQFQSTLPRRERLVIITICFFYNINFNPRSREGSDTKAITAQEKAYKISIHAPAKGATAILYNKFHFLCIILYILSAIT